MGTGTRGTVDRTTIEACLDRDGYYVGHVAADDGAVFLLGVARSLGELYVPTDCDPASPVIRTAPTRRRHAAPFDRPEAIGWHGDFATYEDRPEISLVYVTRPDPRGGDHGAWRLASVRDAVTEMGKTTAGREALATLTTTPVPFAYSEEESARSFPVIERRENERMGFRFYWPSIRRGYKAEGRDIPGSIAAALAELERATDRAARTVPTEEGSLLVISNWFALHDRTPQTISRTRAKREALLCFVARQHDSQVDGASP